MSAPTSSDYAKKDQFRYVKCQSCSDNLSPQAAARGSEGGLLFTGTKQGVKDERRRSTNNRTTGSGLSVSSLGGSTQIVI